MGSSTDADVREGFLELYRDLFSHVSYLETIIEAMIHGQHVDRVTLENHLTQMIASISVSLKKHTLPKMARRPRRNHPDYFRYEMIRVTKVIKDQLAVLLKTSFLVSLKKHTLPKMARRPRRNHPDYFRYEMIRVTKVIKDQLAVLLKTSFLVET